MLGGHPSECGVFLKWLSRSVFNPELHKARKRSESIGYSWRILWTFQNEFSLSQAWPRDRGRWAEMCFYLAGLPQETLFPGGWETFWNTKEFGTLPRMQAKELLSVCMLKFPQRTAQTEDNEHNIYINTGEKKGRCANVRGDRIWKCWSWKGEMAYVELWLLTCASSHSELVFA